MNHENEDAYLRRKRNRIRLHARLHLGFQQLLIRPYCMLIPLLLLILSINLWKCKTMLIPLETIPLPLLPICQHIISFGIILIPTVLLFGYIHFLGDITARQDESDLIVAFLESDLRNGHPILIGRKKLRGNIIVREFHSNIPMKIWLERKEELADQMNIHFISPEIEYGGKGNNNRNRIRLYTAPGKKQIDRGTLYDDEL